MSETTTESKTRVRKAKPEVPCTCGQIVAIYKAESVPLRTAKNGWALGVERGTVKASIECDAVTKSKFAPGHDSRLVGLLQDAVRADAEAKVTVNGSKPEGLVDWITSFSEHLAVKVLADPPAPRTKAKADEAEGDEPTEGDEPEAEAPKRSRRRRTV